MISAASALRSGPRIRFQKVELSQADASRCAARVELTWASGEICTGIAEGDDSPRGRLRCIAEAAAQALVMLTHHAMELVVLTVREIAEVDTILAVVQLSTRNPVLEERLVGSCLIKSQPDRAAALAVLSATNRLISMVVANGATAPAGGTAP